MVLEIRDREKDVRIRAKCRLVREIKKLEKEDVYSRKRLFLNICK